MPSDLAGAHVLVIGASGFLGGRLVERLVLEHGARVRILVRKVMGAAPLARFPLEVVVGDMLDARAVAAAAQGCSVIFNCAKGKGGNPVLRRAVDSDGVRNVVEAARANGARVVHVSSFVVYDLPREGQIDEQSPAAPRGDAYTDTKRQGEQLALELGARNRVPVVVIQPTVVYGPNAGVHGAEILEELRTSRMILVEGGAGICNAVYVDDVVTALLLAAVCERAPGERFLISGPEYPTWRDFFGAFEHMLGVKRTVSMSSAQALTLWRQSQRRAWLLPELLHGVRRDTALRDRLLATREGMLARQFTERVLWKYFSGPERAPVTIIAPVSAEQELPLGPIRPWLVHYLASKVRVRIDKAHKLLGYQPAFDLEAGMRLTEEWARWARLLA